MRDFNNQIHLRHDIYFSLTLNQRRKFHSLGYVTPLLENITMSDFLKITKNEELRQKLIELKRSFITLKVG